MEPSTQTPGRPSWPYLPKAPQLQQRQVEPPRVALTPTRLAPRRPGHLESLPAFVLPEASSPDEESSSSDSSDRRSSTMERRGPGERGEGERGGQRRKIRALPGPTGSPAHSKATWSFLKP